MKIASSYYELDRREVPDEDFEVEWALDVRPRPFVDFEVPLARWDAALELFDAEFLVGFDVDGLE